LGGFEMIDLSKKNKQEDKKKVDLKDETKKLNRWTVFGLVFISALITIIYVDNVFRIDGLLVDIQKIKKKKDFLKNENEMLSTKLNYLQSPERITTIAFEKLGMVRMENLPELLPER
jgi:cell division protein FtsL